MNIIELTETPSTNTWAKENAAQLNHGDIVITHNQTAGRGQRGNSWEAMPGKNLTFSLVLHPENIAPANQFFISETVALAVADTLCEFLSQEVEPERIKIKWPNDIYVDNLKIAGILIEHSICGKTISGTIAGIGLNVNQPEFRSDAPNPVSMLQLCKRETPLLPVLECICTKTLNSPGIENRNETHTRFLNRLWRNDGKMHTFATPQGKRFYASIIGVEPDGTLQLKIDDGTIKNFAFKEVAFIITP